MRMTLAAALPLALALAACQTYPTGGGPYGPDHPYPGQYNPDGYPPSTYPAQQATYRATGAEPFWELTIGRDMTFVDRGINLVVTEAVPARRNAFAGEIYQGRRLNVNIVHGRCSDGMSDRAYPDQVQVWVDGRNYRGCGGPVVGVYPADGGPAPYPGQMPYMLRETNWTVVAINGRPTPRNGFYLNFMPDRLSGKFGCNSLGSSYDVAGNMLTAGAVLATRMACPDMSFESQGSAVLAQPMTISGSGDRLTLSNRSGTIELMRAG